jgi:hypothetical protein
MGSSHIPRGLLPGNSKPSSLSSRRRVSHRYNSKTASFAEHPSEMEVRDVGQIVRTVDELVRNTSLIWWFRGHADSCWPLLPHVWRGYSDSQERYLTNEFYVRAGSRHHNCPGQDDYAGWLALMQHYGLPTRLLDWSASPLIASFFATRSTGENTDACIWALAPGPFNRQQGLEPLLYPLNAASLRCLLRPAFKGNDKKRRKIAAAMPVESDTRMQMQQGAFTVHSAKRPLEKMEGSSQWLRKFVIPAKAKEQMSWELKLMGFRLGDLFPDLGNLAAELKGRHVPIHT